MSNLERILSTPVWAVCLITLTAHLVAAPARGDSTGETASGRKLLWSVTPYIWATDTKYDLTAQGTPIDAGKVTFDDLLDTTDSSFQIAIESGFEDGYFSAFVDITYLETSDDFSGDLLRLDTQSEQWFIDAALAYWPQGAGSNLNVFGGVRYTDLDDDYKIKARDGGDELLKFGPQRDFYDALVGARYRFDLAERWALLTHADYAYGDSDGIFILQTLLRYTLDERKRYNILLGYRYKEADLEEGGLEEDYEYKGPVLGLNLRF